MSGSRGSSIRLLDGDKGLQSDGNDVILLRDYVKGHNDSDASDRVGKFAVRFRGFPLVARLLEKFRDARTVVSTERRPYFFQLTAEDAHGGANASWWRGALSHVGAAAPPGMAYLPHSGRSMFASGSWVVAKDMVKTCYIGGWAPDSTTVAKHYIDPTYPCDAHALFFFGWLRSQGVEPSD